MRPIRIGTRGSALARWQTDTVARMLTHAHPQLAVEIVVIQTQGDQRLDVSLAELGGKGAFTSALEHALYDKTIDLAVHSLKDLPTTAPDGLVLGAIPARGAVHDVLISRMGYTLGTLPENATIGTGSVRRAAQMRHWRSDVQILALRGNVDTRIGKALAENGDYDAIILAQAGVERLGQTAVITQELPLDVMLPAPAQGALAVQCRTDSDFLAWLAPLDDPDTRLCVTLERAFLASLGSGCSLPVGAYAHFDDERMRFHGRVLSLDGTTQYDLQREIVARRMLEDITLFGTQCAQDLLERGAKDLW